MSPRLFRAFDRARRRLPSLDTAFAIALGLIACALLLSSMGALTP